MLTHLTIKNFGLIDNLSLDFDKGLNVLTGATGAGKSIIIDALHFALGGRLKSSQIRDDDKACFVEAVFELQDNTFKNVSVLQEILEDIMAEQDGSLIIQRQSFSDGRNKIKVNGLSVTVAQLKNLGNHLVDFHGPHDHQMLLSEEEHLGILDQLVNFGQSKDEYIKLFNDYTDLQNQWKNLQSLRSSRDRELELLGHHIKELEQVSLKNAQYEQLCQEQLRINNAEKLYEHASTLKEIFDGSETNISELIRQSFVPLRYLTQIDTKVSSWEEYLNSLQSNSESFITELREYLESLSFQPEDASEINRKYDIYEDIKRKYGPTLEDAERYYTEAKEKYSLLLDLDHNDSQLQIKIKDVEKELQAKAKKLTALRKKTAVLLKETIERELKDLGIEQVAFEVRFFPTEFHKAGQDKIVFYISPNAGEDLKPLADIVSSGEAARLMLALKRALTKVDPIPVLIFDEIDAQIGGRLGTVTGQKLKHLSKDRQVILITHLPQIASFADRHLKVDKIVKDKRTQTVVRDLAAKERIEELAHMMTGDDKTQISLSHAQDLLEKAGKGR